MPSRLTNRFEGYPRLQPETSRGDAALVDLVRSQGITASVFHVLDHVPEQCEDLYILLCDDNLVVSFEVLHGKMPLQADQIVDTPINEYRHKIGQGKHRIRLDETLKNARVLLGRWERGAQLMAILGAEGVSEDDGRGRGMSACRD
jgi:hypothetical protein